MTSEIFAFIQPNLQTNTAQNINTVSSSEGENPELNGLFESLITEYSEDINNEIINIPVEQPEVINNFNFNGNNSFSGSVLDILAGVNINPEENNILQENFFADIQASFSEIVSKVKNYVSERLDFDDFDTEKFISELPEILNDESLNEKINLIPEESKQEVIQAVNEFVDALRNNDDVKSAGAKLVNVLSGIKINIPDENKNSASNSKLIVADDNKSEKTSDSEDYSTDTEIYSNAGNIAGLAAAVVSTSPYSEVDVNAVEPENLGLQQKISLPDDSQNSGKIQNAQAQQVTKNITAKNNNSNAVIDPENLEANENDFVDVLKPINTERENSEGNNNNNSGQENNANQNPEQKNENTQSVPENSTRSRNTTRTANNNSSLRTQNDRENSSSTNTTHRTDSRNNFQAFFEGVLNNRRTVSQNSVQPLSLRTNYNFSQSETLSNGLVNVVRFIRADGVQRANVVIDPPALGRISVELTSGTSGVEASIKVASEQIRQLVQDQLSQLKLNLSQQGVQVAEFSVDVQQDLSQQQNSQDGNNNNRYRRFAINEIEDEPEEFRIDLEDGLLYWVA